MRGQRNVCSSLKRGAWVLKVAKTLMEKFSIFSSRILLLVPFINQ